MEQKKDVVIDVDNVTVRFNCKSKNRQLKRVCY